MTRTLSGRIQSHEAWIVGHVRGGRLVLANPAELRLVIDTGFTGTLALPSIALEGMDLKLLGSEWYTLADGREIDYQVYRGWVRVGRVVRAMELIPAEGDGLIGMEFLERMGDELRLQFRRKRVELLSAKTTRGRGRS